MSIDEDLVERLMEGRSPGGLFGETAILGEPTTALAERAPRTERAVDRQDGGAEAPPAGRGQPANRRTPEDGEHAER